jgi:hypothetical protein
MKRIARIVLGRLLKAAKHAAIVTDAKKIARTLNAKIDLPVLNEEQEQAVFENALKALQQALR